MSFLIPLGLLGLLGLIALMVIYLLKPNYQQKVVSSTFVWKLSLKYKKKRIPISRLRNLLILLCQILFICCAAMLLAQPVIITSTAEKSENKIIIIDASADMFAKYDGQTRFERAVEQARDEARSVLNNNGYVSVILAGREAKIEVLHADKLALDTVETAFNEMECSYGVADMDGAMQFAEDLLAQNPESEVVLYSGTHYANEVNNVTVKYVSVDEEWNAAIISARAEKIDGFFEFTIEVACYGAGDKALNISCFLTDYNGLGENVSIPLPVARVETRDSEIMTLKYSARSSDMTGYNFTNVHLEEGVFTFSQMFVTIQEQDSIDFDNEYIVYGAVRPQIKLYYYTTNNNPFYPGIISALEESARAFWDIKVTEGKRGSEIETEGYDFYIYENVAPDILPKDGVVFLANPNIAGDAGFELGAVKSIENYDGDGQSLAPGIEHKITEYVEASLFKVTQYTEVNEDSLDGYDVLMYCQGNPVFFVKDDPGTKIGVVTFSTAYSNFNIDFLFPLLMRCFFDYYFPTTFDGNIFGIYSDVEFTPRGMELSVSHKGEEVKTTQVGNENKWQLSLTDYGTYRVTQRLLNGNYAEELFYVTVPVSESNIKNAEDILEGLHVEKLDKFTYDDLLVYFAAVLVALLFLERLLLLQEGM